MIDPDVFASEWALICERFNRNPSRELTARYFDILSPQMTTGEFRAAAVHVLNTAEFFSSNCRPIDFLHAVRPDPAVTAIEQWELCERVMEGEHHVLDRMTDGGKRVVAMLGGPVMLGKTSLDSVQFVRKEFLARYREVTEGHGPALLGADVTPDSRRIVGEVMRGSQPITLGLNP